MVHHQVPPTTHTVELAQLAELSDRLSAPGVPRITAGELGLSGAAIRSGPGGALPGSAVLIGLSWDGPPEYPYIHGRFASAPGAQDASVAADVHTDALKELNRILGLHQRWGV